MSHADRNPSIILSYFFHRTAQVFSLSPHLPIPLSAFFLAAFLTCAAHSGEERTLPVNENLIVDGVPKIPISLIADVDAYSEFRAASLFAWHPIRREILIGTRFSDVTHIHHVKFPGGDRQQLTFRREAATSATYEPLNGNYFIYTRDMNGAENFQKYRFDVETHKTTLLTDGKSRNVGGVWSQRGDRFAFMSNKRNGKDMDLVVMDPLKPDDAQILLEREGGGWSAVAWSPDDSTLLLDEGISANESYLWLLDVASKKLTPLIKRPLPQSGEGASEPAAYMGGVFSRDGRGVFTATDRDSDVIRIAYIDLQTGRHSYLTLNTKWSIEHYSIARDNCHIAYVTNEEGLSVLHVADMSGREIPVPKMDPGQITALGFHRNGRDLGFNYSNVHTPPDAYSFSLGTGKIERWTFSETGGLDTSHFAAPELVKWPSFDGRMIPGFLYRPPVEKFNGKRPVLVDVHGGPESQYKPTFLGRNNYLLDRLGIALVFPNVRGSSGYGKEYLKLDNGFKREDSYKDMRALFDWIATQPELDAERIMVTGGSYGGHMTLVAATHFADKIRCSMDVVGMSNLATMLKNTSGYRQDLRRVEYGDERDPKMFEFMNKIAPLNLCEKCTKPLFVVQGANDPRVPKSEADQMVAAVKKCGTPVWYLVGKNEGHGFQNAQNRNYLFYATVMFMKQYLLN